MVAKRENSHRAYCHLIDSHRHRSIRTRVVHVGRYGAWLQPGLRRRLSVHAASMHGGVALAAVPVAGVSTTEAIFLQETHNTVGTLEENGVGGGGGVVWCVVCVVQMIKTRGSLSCEAPEMQLIRVAEHLGASSRRPRHPFPALMAGFSPGRVQGYTALKTHPVTP